MSLSLYCSHSRSFSGSQQPQREQLHRYGYRVMLRLVIVDNRYSPALQTIGILYRNDLYRNQVLGLSANFTLVELISNDY